MLPVSLVFCFHGAIHGQEDDATAGGADEDPTRTVLFNLRYEHRELKQDGSVDLVLLRRDAAIHGRESRPRDHKLALLRFDLPFGRAEAGGERQSGLGDLYAQAIHVHPFSSRFSFGSGTGVFFPTADDELLGTGKWMVAPLAVPVWFLSRPRGIFYCKVQDAFSVAGSDHRPDVHVLAVTPTLLWRFKPRAWLIADSEARVDWRDDQASYKSGLLLGTTVGRGRGFWVKLEVPWGEHRLGEWTAKTSLAWRRRR